MDRDVEPELVAKGRGPGTGRQHDLPGPDGTAIRLDAGDPAPGRLERPDRGALDDRRARPLRGVRECPDVAARIHLGIERAVRGGHDRVGQDRRELAGLVAGQVLHRDPVGDTAGNELAHDHGLRLGHRVDEPAPAAQAEVLAELVGERFQAGPRGHHEVQLRALPARVQPDEPEIPSGRARRQPIRLQQRDRHAATREVVRRRGPDDAAPDDKDVRGRAQGSLHEDDDWTPTPYQPRVA